MHGATPSASPGFRMADLKTRARIMILVILAALPALLLTLYSAIEQRETAEVKAREELRRLVKLAAMQQSQVVEGARQMMGASAQVMAMLQDDPRHCSEYFAGLLKQNRGVYHSMGLYLANGQLYCNAVTWHDKVYGGDRLYFRLAKETGKFAVGEYQIGRVTGEAGVNFGFPVFGARNKVTAVAFAGLDLESLGRMAEATPLPAGGILSVVDVKGTIVARKPALKERIGQRLWNPQLIDSVLAGREGVFEAKDGDEAGWVFTHEVVTQNPDGAFPLRVIVAVPLQQIFADANRVLVRDLLGIVLATVFLLVGAWFGAEWFVLRKIRAIVGAAERMRSGELSARTGIRYGREELGQLAQVFDDMAEVLEQREQLLQKQAITDPLTGLYNRRYFAELLPREMIRAERGGTSVAVILMDLDYFKRINDTLGHEAGDLALKSIGVLLRSKVRGSDIACRHGGEEFALVLPQADAEAARRRTEDIRVAVERLVLSYRGKPMGRMTASFGIALYPANAGDMDSLLRAADRALYEAKGAGRNCIALSAAKRA
jgi:diguanylate cyclase (GGDEF)-like protein